MTHLSDEMFEITKNELRLLSDVSLRELVARLCEAELAMKGAPISAVRWGGHQTAPDGGLDVDCRIEDKEFEGDFVPRPRTGFQVKKSTMPPNKIASEMSPKGQLRPIFEELSESNSCYIIVSLDDDPTESSADSRVNEMKNQLNGLNIKTRFYGRNDLAQWLRQHPGVQLWARDILGIPLKGWKAFGKWTNSPPSDSDDLICKPGLQILLPKGTIKYDIKDAIEEIRNLVQTSDKTLRIVGHSGVGKTRLVQALFEKSVGNNALPYCQAIYADLGTDLQPSPDEMLTRLATEDRRAIVILDNCSSETHNRLAGEILRLNNSKLCLITVEYDIREDKPEFTTVIQIKAEGTKIVEALVSRRFPKLGFVNSQRIAEFSGGNPRLGLVLADAVEEGENLSRFSNAQLFERLFHQRGSPDKDLLEAAQALSLVYSFSTKEDEDGVNELETLGSLVDQDRRALHKATQILIERQLVQQRGHWRAILPLPVSNWLATKALDMILPEDLPRKFEELKSPRLLKSFGKRLGYLHDCRRAQHIVRSWLSPNGLLHAVERLDADHIQLFENIAPVVPDAILDVIETRAEQLPKKCFFSDWSQENRNVRDIAILLCSIAYDSNLFTRCVSLLVQFLIEGHGEVRTCLPMFLEPNDIIHNCGLKNYVATRILGLFSLYLSGTMASPDLREQILRQYLFSEKKDKQKIGLVMLEGALKSKDWRSLNKISVFQFGARPRSFGYKPDTPEEKYQWFCRFISVAEEAATSNHIDLSKGTRKLLAGELRNLWKYPSLRPALDSAARAVSNNSDGPWLEGWHAVQLIRDIDYHEAEDLDMQDGIELLDKLYDFLCPDRLVDKVRAYVFKDCYLSGYKESYRQAASKRAYSLGVAVFRHPEVLDELSQEMFTGETRFPNFPFDFGKGLGSACNDLRSLWNKLVEYLVRAENEISNCDTLNGVLAAIYEKDESLARAILSEAAENLTLRSLIIQLHLSVPIFRNMFKTLIRALDFDDTPIEQFKSLARIKPWPTADEDLLCDLLLRLLEKSGGPQVVVFILGRQIIRSSDIKLNFGLNLKKIGLHASVKTLQNISSAEILQDISDEYNGIFDINLAKVLEFCLDKIELLNETSECMNAFLNCVKKTYGMIDNLYNTASILAKKLPLYFLDSIFLNEAYRQQILFERDQIEENILNHIDIKVLIKWCNQGNFQKRLIILSKAANPLKNDADSSGFVFTNLAQNLINRSENPTIVLNNFMRSIMPRSSSGSLADIIAQRSRPFEVLLQDDHDAVRRAAKGVIDQIRELEAKERQREQTKYQDRDQSFE
ncbi:MAG: hypothetical protein ERJ67_07980 [Aphanocapsa feldmannii 277cV]|uniref:Uncharacterized protein n=1 Tax=Aphanocapsa feldmannii 277cV TaxID=2507553 RepID=A0A524RM71_9CHRO|nr:MAG: hypothetical protein ERJ67_07980 [Aphanocapsa feldmannii 277cV]